MRPTQPMQSSSKAPLTKLSPMKQMRIWAMTISEKSGRHFHKTKEAGSELPASSIPVFSFFLEDPHDNGPQEYENKAYGEYV